MQEPGASLALFAGRKRKRTEAPATNAAPSSKAAPPEAAGVLAAHSEASSFSELGLSPWLVNACKAVGIVKPTPVQAMAIPHVLAGRDVIGSAQTGTGKTAAFALPILQRLSRDPYGIFAVVLTPSRELACQISEQFTVFGSGLGLRVCTVVGGMDIVTQAAELAKQPHVVVATPGRLAHHIKLGSSPPDLSRLAFLVLDEADRLLEESFREDLHTILQVAAPPAPQLPQQKGAGEPSGYGFGRQTLLFSATLPMGLLQDAQADGALASTATANMLALRCPVRCDVITSADQLTVAVCMPQLRQEYLFVPTAVKNAYLFMALLHLLATEAKGLAANISTSSSKKPAKKKVKLLQSGAAAAAQEEDEEEAHLASAARSAIVFASTCKSCQMVCEMLIELGIPCTALHAAMPQAQRFASLSRFKSQVVRVLVATDVASRGLDIPTVDLVVNYDIPQVPSDYIHRVGRTARAGRGGRSLSLVTQYDVELLQTIEQGVLRGRKLQAMQGIEEEAVLTKLNKVTAAYHLAKNRLAERGFEERLEAHTKRKRQGKAQREKTESS